MLKGILKKKPIWLHTQLCLYLTTYLQPQGPFSHITQPSSEDGVYLSDPFKAFLSTSFYQLHFPTWRMNCPNVGEKFNQKRPNSICWGRINCHINFIAHFPPSRKTLDTFTSPGNQKSFRWSNLCRKNIITARNSWAHKGLWRGDQTQIQPQHTQSQTKNKGWKPLM